MSDEDIRKSEREKASYLRSQSSDVQGVHQIIAISEDAINKTLQSRFSQQLRLKRDMRLREFHHIDEDGGIEAILDAPRIQLALPTGTSLPPNEHNFTSITAVIFYLNFFSGTYHWWRRSTKKQQQLKGWSLAFRVPLGITDLDSIPHDISQKLNINKPDAYSASQILLSLSAAALAKIDFSASLMPNLPNDQDEADKVKAEFTKYLTRYFMHLQSGPYSVLGYQIKLKNPQDGPQATTPPKSARTVLQRYRPQTDAFKSKFPTRDGLDSLLFLKMTTENTKDSYDANKGSNWVYPGLSNSLAMSREVFLENYLLRKLSALNMSTLTVANDMYHWFMLDKDSGLKNQEWKITTAGRPSSAPFSTPETNFQGTVSTFRFNAVVAEDVPWIMTWRRVFTVEVYNIAMVSPGKNSISIDLRIYINVSLILYKKDPKTFTTDDVLLGYNASVRWPSIIFLSTIQDGKLGVEVKPQETQYDSSPSHNARITNEDFIKICKQQAADAGTKVKNAISIDSVKDSLSSILQAQSAYVFPGGSDFFMKDPVFNGNGDVVIGLNYVERPIVIEDDFRFFVDQKAYPQCKNPWIKLESDAEQAQLILVPTREESSVFMIDNGNLIVVKVKQGSTAGENEFFKWSLWQDTSSDTTKKLIFVNKATFHETTKPPPAPPENELEDAPKPTPKATLGKKLECNTTGSLFEFQATEKRKNAFWQGTFVLSSEGKVQLYTGERDDAKGKYFMVSAMY